MTTNISAALRVAQTLNIGCVAAALQRYDRGAKALVRAGELCCGSHPAPTKGRQRPHTKTLLDS